MIPIPKNLLSRLLYVNPVCALVTKNCEAENGFNVMTISWISPVDNHGLFTMSINKGRHTLMNLLPGTFFSISPFTEESIGVALLVGGSSGAGILGGKLEALGISVSPCGGASSACDFPALNGAPAHLFCRVVSLLSPSDDVGGEAVLKGHTILLCTSETGWVDPSYWREGKLFSPSLGKPRLVGFLGSKKFATIEPVLEGSVDLAGKK